MISICARLPPYPITREGLLKALELLQQAIAVDRRCGPALSLAAMCQMRLVRESWAEEPEDASRIDLARRALQVAGDDPSILANAAFVLANFGEDMAFHLMSESGTKRNCPGRTRHFRS
jgi:hypothetical protein